MGGCLTGHVLDVGRCDWTMAEGWEGWLAAAAAAGALGCSRLTAWQWQQPSSYCATSAALLDCFYRATPHDASAVYVMASRLWHNFVRLFVSVCPSQGGVQ